jgi:HAMP domain-containing protein
MNGSVLEERERSEMKAELLNAWDQIEQLHDEREEVVERNLVLVCEVEAARQREEHLRWELCRLRQKMEQQKLGHEANEGSQSSLKGLQRRGSITSVSSTASCSSRTYLGDSERSSHDEQSEGRWFWKRSSYSLVEEKERLETEFSEKLADIEREKEDFISEFETRLKIREALLEEMQKTKQIQDETLDELCRELKIQQQASRDVERKYQDEIVHLKKKLKAMDRYILKQDAKMDDYRSYIEDLTTEMERVYCSKPANEADPETTAD